MAVNEATLSALGTLERLVEGATARREAAKDRAMRIMAMKVSSDERELDRLSNLRNRTLDHLNELTERAAQLFNVRDALNRLEEKSGVKGSDAKSIVGQDLSKLASDRGSIVKNINEMDARIKLLQQGISEYGAAIGEAPEVYRKYAGLDDESIYEKSIVDPEEWQQMITDLEKGGRVLSEPERAAYRKVFEAMSTGEFRKLYDTERLKQYGRQLDIMAQRARATEGPEPIDRNRMYVSNLKQQRERIIGRGRALGLDPERLATVPDVLTDPQDVSTIATSYADEISRLASKHRDWWRTGIKHRELAKLLDQYKEAAHDPDQRENVALEIARYFQTDRKRFREALDTQKFIGKEDEDRIAYLSELLRGFNIAESFQTYLMTGEALDFRQSVPEELKEEDGFSLFWGPLGAPNLFEAVQRAPGATKSVLGTISEWEKKSQAGKEVLDDILDFLNRNVKPAIIRPKGE